MESDIVWEVDGDKAGDVLHIEGLGARSVVGRVLVWFAVVKKQQPDHRRWCTPQLSHRGQIERGPKESHEGMALTQHRTCLYSTDQVL